MENKNTLQLHEFYSVCTQMVFHSGKIIQEVFDPSGTIYKSKDNDEGPFTEADLKIQDLITKGLRSFWPEIKVVGEEDEAPEKLEFDWSSLKKEGVSKDLLTGSTSTEIDLSKAIVWIDPLDGTVEFVKGALDCVTTLIGISVEGQSKVGVVGQYFVEKSEGKYEWQPKCYFASADHPHLYCMDYSNGNKIEELQAGKTEDPSKLTLYTSRNHFSAGLQERIDRVNPDKVIKVGGAGNKIIRMICGGCDCSFYPKPGMKKWDICAGEALVKSVGGVVTDGLNNPITYEEEKSTWPCSKGVVTSISKEKHNRVMEPLLKGKETPAL